MSATVSSGLLTAAASLATAALEPANSGLLAKVQTVAGTAEHSVSTFLSHNEALVPVVSDLTSLVMSQGEQHAPMFTEFLLSLAKLIAGLPSATVHTGS